MNNMRAIKLTTLALALTLADATVLSQTRSSSAPYRVIANSGNPSTAVDRRFLVDAFLKKTTRWPTDAVIRPVDLDPDSPVRRRFSEEVIQRSVSAVKGYWQQQIFSGRDVPPPEFDSDEDVVKYVVGHAGAVGYVSSGANITGVKVLTVK